jgi:shikimate dehydrogenase
MMDRTCFVIGHPISHSRSPMIHGHWLRENGIAGSYERIDVAPSGLEAFVGKMRKGTYLGGNVTVPHKQAILPLLDRLSDDAKVLGAVNTIYRDGALLCGDNTDAAGFLGHLDAAATGWQNTVRTALVLGAGGASLAIVQGLRSRGVSRIIVANRDPARSKALATRFGDCIEAIAWDERSAHVGLADLVVNTTSLGMVGQPALDIDLSALKATAIVDDIVYVPLETPLLQAARQRGALAVDGLGMLLNQAIPGFERWFGIKPVISPELRLMLEADIRKGH